MTLDGDLWYSGGLGGCVTPAAGTTVADRFRLVRPLRQGGMGSVWLAQHIGLDIPCAIKFMHAQGVSKEVRHRFEREAKVAAQIRSPHVVQILDHGVWKGTPYIAMEYLEGEDLDHRIQRVGRLDPHDTMAITAQVARALTKAHAAGLVHRDLKPANIFIVRDDDREIAKVLDFGIAKDSTPKVTSNTKTGSLLGTPAYMSPEQAQGTKSIDHRSDLWSLAVVVFECLTGKLPFDSQAFGDLLLKIMVKPLPVPSQLAPVPPGFDAWWARAASREPEARFQSAKEFCDTLAIALDIASDSLEPRTSLTGMFRAPGDRVSVELGFTPRSQEGATLLDTGPNSAAPSLGDAATLVASSDAEVDRLSPSPGRTVASPGEAAGASALSGALGRQMRSQTASALVSVVSPPTKRPFVGRVVAAAAAAAVLVAAGVFLLRGTGPGVPAQPLAQPEATASAPDAPRAPEPVVSAAAPASEPAPSASAGLPAAPASSPAASAVAAPGGPRAPSAQPAHQVKPRSTAPSGTVRRKPKPTDFGI
ncbi:serine/threonine protein kinase [Sorangium sp. So ce1099]|uniref:serine/threonine protein kinase n=1 Tax=Sorangium sp. So ce1099 TaxID=3133331 RepID=UPI003F601E1E